MSIFSDIKAQRPQFIKAALAAVGAIAIFLVCNQLVAGLFNRGLRQYYCLQPAKVLCIGHSMSEMGIEKTRLEENLGVPVSKYCMNGAGSYDRLVMIKHYLETVETPPEIIVYDVSGRSFSGGLSSNSYALFFPFMDESAAVDAYVREQAPRDEYWLKKLVLLNRYDDTRLGAVVRGYRSDWKNRSLAVFDPAAFQVNLKNGNFWKISFEPGNIEKFEETIQLLKSKHIRMVLAGLPSVDMLNQAEPEKYAKAMQIFHDLEKKYDNVVFLDYNPEFSADYSLFKDPIHLNPKGQMVVTERLGKDLKSILSGTAR